MANEIEFFWNALPPDLKGFIVSTAAGWASSLASRLGVREKAMSIKHYKMPTRKALKILFPILERTAAMSCGTCWRMRKRNLF